LDNLTAHFLVLK